MAPPHRRHPNPGTRQQPRTPRPGHHRPHHRPGRQRRTHPRTKTPRRTRLQPQARLPRQHPASQRRPKIPTHHHLQRSRPHPHRRHRHRLHHPLRPHAPLPVQHHPLRPRHHPPHLRARPNHHQRRPHPTPLHPPLQHKLLYSRDLGCTFPGCQAPATHCEAHHITPWQHGGETNLNNAALLCSRHHTLLHNSQWTLQLITGTPYYTPPPTIDPTQTPLRNTYHHGLNNPTPPTPTNTTPNNHDQR
ncbi:HNH endonuclease signature motif containing protein [Arthrobacter stackebrandtii]|uniref:HNH endonuclease signature motif containing protein n=1 Tax=Arthrobacter stackebrandtii TaxID=272161 RepID=UPI003CCA6685